MVFHGFSATFDLFSPGAPFTRKLWINGNITSEQASANGPKSSIGMP